MSIRRFGKSVYIPNSDTMQEGDSAPALRRAIRQLLREARLAAGLRQGDVAARLAVPQSFVSKYESGARRLDIVDLARVCAAIGLPLARVVARLESELDSDATG